MQKFEIILENEKRSIYDKISWFIIAIQFFAIAYFSFFRDSGEVRTRNIILLGIMILFFALKNFFRKSANLFGFHPYFLFMTLAWISRGDYWLAALTLLFDLLSAVALRKLVVVFSAGEVIYPSFPRRIIQWNELSNAILRDGLLTIDFRNNRLIQQYLVKGSKAPDEKEFNEFCIRQLNKSVPS